MSGFWEAYDGLHLFELVAEYGAIIENFGTLTLCSNFVCCFFICWT